MKQKGQALIILIFGMALAVTILSTVVVAAVAQAKNGLQFQFGEQTYSAAESGAEYAALKLLRSPQACSGNDNLNFGSTNVLVSYSTTGTNCTVVSSAAGTNSLKKISFQASYSANLNFTVCCWKEIP